MDSIQYNLLLELFFKAFKNNVYCEDVLVPRHISLYSLLSVYKSY